MPDGGGPTMDPIELARKASEMAEHYNGFKVGCMGAGPNGEVYLGANYKPRQDAEPTCAEEQVMLQAIEDGVVLHTIVVFGKPRKEDTTPTLHCCGERCRPKMRARIKKGVAVRPDTKLICVSSITGFVEEFTVQTLHEAHGESLDD